jgi:hypothetical protein
MMRGSIGPEHAGGNGLRVNVLREKSMEIAAPHHSPREKHL